MEFTISTMTELEFLATVAEQADCGILLDINNIFITGSPRSFDVDRDDNIPEFADLAANAKQARRCTV
jgi:uncharacterized protein (UPF0276 family)